MIRVAFNCMETKKHGLGHFIRCFNLARHIMESKNFEVSFIGNFSPFSLSILNTKKVNVIQILSNDKLFLLLKNYDIIITDRYDINQKHLNRLADLKKTKSILIDDFKNLEFSNQDLVINFRVGIKHYIYNSKSSALGEKFFIYKPELEIVRENYEFNSCVKKILFFGSGTEKSNAVFNNLPLYLLDKYDDIEIIHITTNPFLVDNERYFTKKLDYSIEKYFEKTDVIINGGGLIKYEAAFCGIPSATLSTTKDQHQDTIILEKNSLLYNLGNQELENKQNVESRITNFINDSKLRRCLHNKGNSFFTPKSIKNLIQKINEL